MSAFMLKVYSVISESRKVGVLWFRNVILSSFRVHANGKTRFPFAKHTLNVKEIVLRDMHGF